MVGEIDEKWSIRVEVAPQRGQRDSLVDPLQGLDRLRAAEFFDLDFTTDPLNRRCTFGASHQDTGKARFATDASDGKVCRVADEVGALVTTFQGGAMKRLHRF